jgi:DNA-binding NarL/FixJ family response regulator
MSARTNAAPIKVAIVEDDDELRANLTDYVGRFPDFKLAAAYADAEAALEDLPRLKPEVVLMDMNLPGVRGIECVHHLKVS